jgi:hypothetical protein
LMILITIVITGQSFLQKHDTFQESGKGHTHYNNYMIFKQSFIHLVENKDLYQLYPEEHWDYFKYSPTFALLMAPLAFLPDVLGLFFWNLLNAFVLFIAIWKLPLPKERIHLLMLLVILIELITSLQNSQSNGLIAGLIIFAFLMMEKKQIALACLFIVGTIFIKIFGIVALALFILYPGKLKSALYSAGWIILLTFLPLLVISWSQLIFLYQSWLHLLQADQGISWGLSISGWLHAWFGMELKTPVLIAGILLFCLPFLRYKYFNDFQFRLAFLSSILIWIVIFNHKAESPTYVIAVSGAVIWLMSQKMKPENLILFLLVIVFTVLSPTDFFPRPIRETFVVPYVLKAVPCILVWMKIIGDMLFFKPVTEAAEIRN